MRRFLMGLVIFIAVVWVALWIARDPAHAGTDVHNWIGDAGSFLGHLFGGK